MFTELSKNDLIDVDGGGAIAFIALLFPFVGLVYQMGYWAGQYDGYHYHNQKPVAV